MIVLDTAEESTTADTIIQRRNGTFPLPGGCSHPTFPDKYFLSLIRRVPLHMRVKEKVIKHFNEI
jgi:hypothetical protein